MNREPKIYGSTFLTPTGWAFEVKIEMPGAAFGEKHDSSRRDYKTQTEAQTECKNACIDFSRQLRRRTQFFDLKPAKS